MADEDANRQRMEDMLKADERRPRGGGGLDVEPDRPGSTREDDREPAEQAPSAIEAADEAPPAERGDAEGDTERAAKLAKAGTIAGGISIPAALFPIVGLLLGIGAIVLGVMAGRAAAASRGKPAVGLGIAGVVLSVVIFAVALATA